MDGEINMLTQQKSLLALGLFPIATTVVALFMLPDTIALRFDLSFNPDTYSSKYLMIVPALLILAMNVAIFFFYTNDVKRWNSGKATTAEKKRVTVVTYFAAVIFCDIILLVFFIINM